MASSPFKRRPNLSKTYGKRTSLISTSSMRPSLNSGSSKSDIAKLLLDSSDEAETDSSGSDEDVQARLVGSRRVEVERPSSSELDAAATKGSRTKEKERAKNSPHGLVDTPKATRSNSARTKLANGRKDDEEEDSTIWDEETALSAAPVSRSRRSAGTRQVLPLDPSTSASTLKQLPTRARDSHRESPSRLKRHSSPPSGVNGSQKLKVSDPDGRGQSRPAAEEEQVHSDPPSPPSRKRRRRTLPIRKEVPEPQNDSADDTIPPPFDYVPPPPRLRTSPTKAELRPNSGSVSRSSVSRAATGVDPRPIIRTILPSSSSPTKPAKEPPLGTTPPPASKTQTLNPSIAPPRPKPAQSPSAKDLSSLFSSFSKMDKDLSGDESTASSNRGGLKRSTSGGIVASMAAKRAADRNGRDNSSRAVTPVSPERPHRAPLDRSASQPSLSSPLSSPNGIAPFRSPHRTPLGAASSLPDVLSPSKYRADSTSPRKSVDLHQAPAIGSVYRPVAFSTSGFVENGRARTYGGARSFRLEHEDGLSGTGGDRPSRSQVDRDDPSNSASSAPHLPTLPPSITGRISKPSQARETYAQLREKWGVAAEQELDEDEEHESQERGARVIGTGILRAQGEGKRWNDEMGWTLDGLREGKGGSGARSSAIELLGRTLDRDWMRRLKSSGMVEQVYLAFRRGGAGDGDRVLDIAFVILLAALTRDQRLCEPLFRLSTSNIATSPAATSRSPSTSRSSSISPRKGTERDCELLGTITELFKRVWAKEEIGGEAGGGRKGKTAKNDSRHMQSLREIIDKSNFFEGSDLPVTLRTLLLQVIRNVASFAARPIFQPQQLLCTSGAFEAVVGGFLDECAPLELRIREYSTGLDLIPQARNSNSTETLSPSTLALCLSIFEATSLSTPFAFQLVSSTSYLDPLCRAFRDVTLVASIIAFDTVVKRDQAESDSKLLLSILGILFGLSTESNWSAALLRNHDSKDDGLVGALVRAALKCRRSSKSRNQSTSISRQGANEEEKEEDVEEERPEWDALCLILGVLTNLVESAEETKDSLRETQVSPSCQSNRKCIRCCSCSSPLPVLSILSHFYLDPLDDAPNSVHRTSVAGFLRLLIGLSLVDNPRNESLVLEALSPTLPGPDSSEGHNPMSAIVDALDEFAKLHEQQDRARGILLLENDGSRRSGRECAGHEEDGDGETEQVGRTGDGLDERDVAKRIRLTIERLGKRLG